MKTLIVKPRYGLANRLRVLSEAYSLSRLSGRAFKVNWVPEPACGCKWDDLFIDQYDILETVTPGGDTRHYNFMWEEGGEKNLLLDLFDAHPVIWVESAYPLPRKKAKKLSFLFFREKWISLMNQRFGQKHALLRSLRPVPSVASKIRSLDVRNMVGVHIRVKDPEGVGLSPEITEFEKSTLDNFKKKMNALVQKDKGKKFFLATNHPETQEELARSFPGRIFFLPKKDLSRNKTEAIQEALADFLLLSMTQKILGTHYSSFGWQAAIRGRIPIEII